MVGVIKMDKNPPRARVTWHYPPVAFREAHQNQGLL